MSISRLLWLLLACAFFIACQKDQPPSTALVTPSVDSSGVDSTMITPPLDSAECICHNSNPPGQLNVVCPSAPVEVGGTATFRWELIIKHDVWQSGDGNGLGYCAYDPSIIKIDSTGVLTGLAPGMTTIKICFGTDIDYCTVVVQ